MNPNDFAKQRYETGAALSGQQAVQERTPSIPRNVEMLMRAAMQQQEFLNQMEKQLDGVLQPVGPTSDKEAGGRPGNPCLLSNQLDAIYQQITTNNNRLGYMLQRLEL